MPAILEGVEGLGRLPGLSAMGEGWQENWQEKFGQGLDGAIGKGYVVDMPNKGRSTERQGTMTAKTMTTTEVAAALETDARTLRKFLRDSTPKDSQPGKGARYSLPAGAREIAKMKKQFLAWGEQKIAAAQEKADSKALADETPELEEMTDAEIDAENWVGEDNSADDPTE